MSDANALSGRGRQRLSIVVGAVCGTTCLVAMAVVLVVYGAPYQPVWWWVMAAILAVSCLLGRIVAPAVEWVLEGYLEDR